MTGHIVGMVGKARYDFGNAQYSYGEVESALAIVFGAKRPAEKARLRAHIKHLQRLNLVGGAGKGARVAYSLGQASQWLLALLAAEIGVNQSVIVQTIKKAWPQLLQRWFERALDDDATKTGNPVWLTLRPETMSGWAEQGSVKWIGFLRWKDERSKQLPYTLLTKAVEDEDEWLCARNLTRVMLKFTTALESEGN